MHALTVLRGAYVCTAEGVNIYDPFFSLKRKIERWRGIIEPVKLDRVLFKEISAARSRVENNI